MQCRTENNEKNLLGIQSGKLGSLTINRKNPVIHKNGFKKAFITACTNANIPYGRKVNNGITFHDLRRTAKTNMLIAGLDKVFRDKILGHSLHGMDVNYLVLNEDAVTQTMDKHTQWMDDQLSNIEGDLCVAAK